MTTRNHRIRFLNNNHAASSATTATALSALTGFGLSNALGTTRHKRHIPAGSFEISSTNKTIYINDGSNKTVTLTEATYAGGAALATHAQTQLNASSTNWTVTYSSTTGKFTFGRSSGTALLRLTQTTNAAWDTLGYVGAVDDDVGTGQAADERRNHTSETYTFDLGSARQCRAFCLFGPAGEALGISSTATVTLKANSSSSFSSPPLSVTITPESDGLFYMLDEIADTTYRYWQLKVVDRLNPDGPSFEVGYIFLGDYWTPTARNADQGFDRELVDPSEEFETDGGSLWHRQRTKYWAYNNVQLSAISDDDRTGLEDLYFDVGRTVPFVVALDPTEAISTRLGELTKMVRFATTPTYTHNFYKYWDVSMSFREVV